MPDDESHPTRRTPLHALHVELGARMVEFAGYDMPVQYASGILAEHRHTRSAASLFDVSHMGQAAVTGSGVASAIERLIPADLEGLSPGVMRYAVLTNDDGGIIDDLMVANAGDHFHLVLNAARKEVDLDHLAGGLGGGVEITPLDRALIAVQGPKAATALAELVPGIGTLAFMTVRPAQIEGCEVTVSRSGYTGEDGFEISVASAEADRVARHLLALNPVEPAGLGARDSLRLEAGLCLYGHDIDETTTPVEAGLLWTIAKRRREGGGFPGFETIKHQIEEGPKRRRVGIRLDGRTPAREGAAIRDGDGRRVGFVTSGGFGPSVGAPIAMGYVETGHAAEGTELQLIVRDRAHPGRVVRMPFVPHNYHRGGSQ